MGNKFSISSKRRVASQASQHKRQNSTLSSQTSTDTGIVRQGRSFHNMAMSTYWLPNDDEEMDRLVGQHFALKTLFNGNILREVEEALPLNTGCKILDVGCGPGTWIMDMATEYPASEFTGVDMCETFPVSIRPPNVHFLSGNILERLPFPDNSFDLVNMRLFILALRKEEWPPVLNEIYRVLKPGGMIQSIEAGMLDRGNEFVRWAGETFKNVILKRGQEPYIAFKIQALLEETGYHVVASVKKDAYLGRQDHLNREFLWDICNIFKSAQPFLTEPLGIAPDTYGQFLRELCTNCQATPEARWTLATTVAQKPLALSSSYSH
ncbi:S-adenosyl-L-methionine-dependent methyltransferase [Radiomyces spectabilis]|uniref:S-adenosyl-L-methionine-dependent methyltransferase n=1 Tax=Radiomyces spectabilis TaxID=64574 RepID=UPI00221EC9F0|nr:S-adenosyl-L-methionine-dependent methyltransferase [Radiomyces spectabilis]KAI8391520.1 S-adenosyl-L-methionine-dependent methyltransferase [Radiomyces spectabilis]